MDESINIGDTVEATFFGENIIGTVEIVSGWYYTIRNEHGAYVIRQPDIVRRLDVERS